MTSISFDRAANFYDETRGFPAGIDDLVATSARSALPVQARVLECGIGTGRIALPLMRQQLRVTGIDISGRMMRRLVKRLQSGQSKPDLIKGDATRLPLAAEAFDAVLMVHVLHLISEWQAALQEARRVTKTQGIFLSGFNHHPGGTIQEQIREQWREIVRQNYPEQAEPNSRRFELVKEYLSKSGALLDEWKAAEWSRAFHVGKFIDSLEQKTYSSTWNIPEGVFEQCIADLRTWARLKFGSLDYEVQQQQEFIWQRFRWK